MKDRKDFYALFVLATLVCVSVFVTAVYAHCDSMSGPVIPEAMAALEKSDITPILNWVKA
jgi:hypothetical protein